MLDSDHFDPTVLASGTAGGWWRWSWHGFCTAKRRANIRVLPCQLPTCTLHGGVSWPTRTSIIGMRKCGKPGMNICHTTCMLRCEMCAMFQTWGLSCLQLMQGNKHNVSSPQCHPCQYAWKDTKRYQEAGMHYTSIYNAGHRIQETAMRNGRPLHIIRECGRMLRPR